MDEGTGVLYKKQIPVVEQAIERSIDVGTDKSRGYCLEMICADFLAGANLENEDPTGLLQSVSRFFKFLPGEQRQGSARNGPEGFVNRILPKHPRLRLDPELYERLRKQMLRRDGWRCQSPGRIWRFNTKEFRRRGGDDSAQNLVTLCSQCHSLLHRQKNRARWP